MMKRYIFIITLFIFNYSAHAQCPENQRPCKNDQIKAQKVAYITAKINLTVDEAERFWPIYNAYHKEKHQLVKEHQQFLNKMKDINLNSLNDKELKEYADYEILFRDQLLRLDKKFHSDIIKILNTKKTILYYQAEMEFKHTLLKKLKK